jgi:hypothetical protein
LRSLHAKIVRFHWLLANKGKLFVNILLVLIILNLIYLPPSHICMYVRRCVPMRTISKTSSATTTTATPTTME